MNVYGFKIFSILHGTFIRWYFSNSRARGKESRYFIRLRFCLDSSRKSIFFEKDLISLTSAQRSLRYHLIYHGILPFYGYKL